MRTILSNPPDAKFFACSLEIFAVRLSAIGTINRPTYSSTQFTPGGSSDFANMAEKPSGKQRAHVESSSPWNATQQSSQMSSLTPSMLGRNLFSGPDHSGELRYSSTYL